MYIDIPFGRICDIHWCRFEKRIHRFRLVVWKCIMGVYRSILSFSFYYFRLRFVVFEVWGIKETTRVRKSFNVRTFVPHRDSELFTDSLLKQLIFRFPLSEERWFRDLFVVVVQLVSTEPGSSSNSPTEFKGRLKIKL